MKWNVPIITFLQRTWLLLVAAIAFTLLSLNDTVFQKFGAIVYIPSLVLWVMWSSLLAIHLFFRQTVDLDAHTGKYLNDWNSLTPFQRTLLAVIIRIGLIVGFCILCAGLARGDEPDQEARWMSAAINPKSTIALDADVSLYRRLSPRYLRVEVIRLNGVPAPVIFCLHQRESSGSFMCSLAQGDPLTHRSRHVPRGRIPNVDPPYTWEQCAFDALYVVDRLDRKDWCYLSPRMDAIEGYNGFGYRSRGIPSPYLWSGTSIYTRGKFTRDGHFDRMAIDGQLGCAAILKRMQERGIFIFCNEPP